MPVEWEGRALLQKLEDACSERYAPIADMLRCHQYFKYQVQLMQSVFSVVCRLGQIKTLESNVRSQHEANLAASALLEKR